MSFYFFPKNNFLNTDWIDSIKGLKESPSVKLSVLSFTMKQINHYESHLTKFIIQCISESFSTECCYYRGV